MTQQQRQLLFDALMVGADVELGNDPAGLKLFAESTTEDLDKIEPLIDQMVTDAFRCGKRFGRLKTEEEIAKCSNVPQS
jgi:hypothetical protein